MKPSKALGLLGLLASCVLLMAQIPGSRPPRIPNTQTSFSSSGNQTIVAATTGLAQCVYGMLIENTGASSTTVTIQDGASTAISPPILLTAGGQLNLPFREPPAQSAYFATSLGNALVVNNGSAIAVSVWTWSLPCP